MINSIGVLPPLGWLITTLALTLGAQFWVDLLSKFISLRAAGKKPVDDAVDVSKTTMVTNASLPVNTATVIQKEVTTSNDVQPKIVPDESNDSTLA